MILKDIILQLIPSDRLALISPGGEAITYNKFIKSVRILMNTLKSLDLHPGDHIAIYTGDKATGIMAISACILADLVYVPLDIHNLYSRNIAIIKHCQVKAMIVSQSLSESLEAFLDIASVHPVETFDIVILNQSQPISQEAPLDLAFILNTSGSTGIPKAVMITQKNAESFLDWCTKQYQFSSNDRFASIAPLHFDLSVFDVFVSLNVQATLVLFEPALTKNPKGIAAMIAEHNVSILYATPTFYSSLVDYGKMHLHFYKDIRHIFFAGEPFNLSKLKLLHGYIPNATYTNWYGPTETNVVTFYTLPFEIQQIDQALPIGIPCNHVKAMIDVENNSSSVGELLISGGSVSPGYFKDGENTEISFKILHDICWYKTGDIVSINEYGEYLFHGRRDRMVKRRGYRIELDDIQHHLESLEIFNAVAVVSKNINESLQIFCVYVNEKEWSRIEINHRIQTILPLYMMPDHFIRIETLPLTGTGKIDYQTIRLSL